MRVLYASPKVEEQCNSIRAAGKLFGGDRILTEKLITRVGFLKEYPTLSEVIDRPAFRFHKLKGSMSGLYAIDVKTRKEPWRIILEPLDGEGRPYGPCDILQIRKDVRILRIREVSKHYE